jgi:hypothetical protein
MSRRCRCCCRSSVQVPVPCLVSEPDPVPMMLFTVPPAAPPRVSREARAGDGAAVAQRDAARTPGDRTGTAQGQQTGIGRLRWHCC